MEAVIIMRDCKLLALRNKAFISSGGDSKSSVVLNQEIQYCQKG